jgi:propanol-preferring alcohol dehydrogenase
VDDVTGPSVTTVDASQPDLADRLTEATPYGEGPTVAVDTVGDIETLEAAWDALAMGGQVVTLTTHHERSFAPLLKDFVVKEASVVGSRYATKEEVVRAARLIADGRVDPVVTDEVGLEAVPSVHADIRSGDTYGMTVLNPSR